MKRYIPILLLATALIAGCTTKQGHHGFIDNPADNDLGFDREAMHIEEAQGSTGMTADGSHFVTGVALRGSKHSITIHVINSDEDLQFSFPTLPIDKIAIWNPGDTVTIYFKELNSGNDVTRVVKGGPLR